MAKSIGTIFVELSLDDKVYKQRLSDTLTSTQTTAKGIETSWRALGVKNDQTYDAQRRAYENAMTLIKNSTTSTAQDIIRAEQAKSEKIKQLNEQQFGKQTSLLETLKSNWIATAAVVGAAYVAAQKAWNVAEQASRYEQSREAFHSMATSMGKDATVEFEKIRKASGGLIDDQALTEAANKALSLGIPIEKIGDLMLIARAKSRDMGTTAQQAFTDIATGVGRASPLILDNLGLVMKVGAANDAMAASLGKTVAELTDQEKKTAILNATLAAGKEALARYDLEQKTTAENMQAMKATAANLELLMGQGIIRAVSGAVGAFQSLSAASMTVSSGIWKMIEAKERLAAFATFGEAERQHMELAKQASQNAAADFKSSLEYAGKAQNNFALMTASVDSLAAATKKSGTTAVQAGKDYTGASEKAKERAIIAANAAKEEAATVKKAETEKAADAKKTGDLIIQMYEDEEKKADSYYDKVADWQEDQVEKKAKGAEKELKDIVKMYEDEEKEADDYYEKIAKWQGDQVKTAKEAADKRGEYEREVYKDLRGYANEYFAAEATLIQQQGEKYKAAGVDEVAVATWVAQQLADLNLKKLRSSDDFVDGVKAGLIEMKNDTLTFGQAGYEAIRTMAESSKTALSDILFQGLKTGTVDAKAVWETFTDSMLGKFTDTLSKMIVDAAAKDILMMFQAEWTADSSSILGIINKGLGIFDYFFGGGSGADIESGFDTGDYYAKGGRYPADRPFWVGEEGPELIFPNGTSGQVLSHPQSVSYASRNSIPGYAGGTGPNAAQIEAYYALQALGGFGWSGLNTADIFTPNNPGGIWIDEDGVVHDTRHGSGGWFNEFMKMAVPLTIAAVGGYYTAGAMGSAAFGGAFSGGALATMKGQDADRIAVSAIMAYYAGTAGEYANLNLGGLRFAGGSTAAAGEGTWSSVGVSDLPALVAEMGWNWAVGYAKDRLITMALKYAFGSLFGSDPSAKFSFAGIDSDMGWLSALMGDVAPKSDTFAFSARDGLDYVPYDNFPILAHKGERVQTAEEAKNSRRGTINLNVVINGSRLSPDQMAKQIVRPLRREISRIDARVN